MSMGYSSNAIDAIGVNKDDEQKKHYFASYFGANPLQTKQGTAGAIVGAQSTNAPNSIFNA